MRLFKLCSSPSQTVGFCRSKNVGSRQDFVPNRLWLEGRPRKEDRINENSSALGRNGDLTEAFLHVSPKALAFLIKNSILWRLRNLFKIEHAWTGSVWTQAINTCSLQVRVPLAGHKTVLFPMTPKVQRKTSLSAHYPSEGAHLSKAVPPGDREGAESHWHSIETPWSWHLNLFPKGSLERKETYWVRRPIWLLLL